MTLDWQSHFENLSGEALGLKPTTSSDGSGKEGAPEPIGLTAAEAAALLGVSESHFYTLHKSERLGPLPVRMGRAVRWPRQELIDWFNAGSPPRSRWQALRHSPRHRGISTGH